MLYVAQNSPRLRHGKTCFSFISADTRSCWRSSKLPAQILVTSVLHLHLAKQSPPPLPLAVLLQETSFVRHRNRAYPFLRVSIAVRRTQPRRHDAKMKIERSNKSTSGPGTSCFARILFTSSSLSSFFLAPT